MGKVDDKLDINSKLQFKEFFGLISNNVFLYGLIGILGSIVFIQSTNPSIFRKARSFQPVTQSMRIEDKEPDYLKEILNNNQQLIINQNQVIKESRLLSDVLATKLEKVVDKDMEFKISLESKLTNHQLDLKNLNQVVENMNSLSSRNSRVSETTDNLEPPFMRKPHNSLISSSSLRPLTRSSRIEPSISISVSKKFSFMKLNILFLE